MKTIFSDGKTLEIERKLKITVFLPQPCYFCGEEIIKMRGKDPESLLFHSLDGNHDNWDPDNKVPAHRACHVRFHWTGEHHTEEVRKKIGKAKLGEKNPMYGRTGDESPRGFLGKHHTEEHKKMMSERRMGDKNPFYGKHHTEETKKKMGKAISEAMGGEDGGAKRGWDTRRKRYPPNGMKPKEVE